MAEKKEKPIEPVKELEQFLPKNKQEELAQILAFGEKIKAEGERKKEEFWSNHKREDLDVLLYNYRDNRRKFFSGLDSWERQIFSGLEGILFDKFVEEYIRTFIFYSNFDAVEHKKADCIRYDYKDFQEGKIVMVEGKYILLAFNAQQIRDEKIKSLVEKIELTEGTYLNLSGNWMGDDGIELISKNIHLKEGMSLNLSDNNIGVEGVRSMIQYLELKDGVNLNLSRNNIGSIGAKELAKNIKIKPQMKLDLSVNDIGAEGAEEISHMELKEGVELYLDANNIGNTGAQALIDNLKLKEGVKIHLYNNDISDEKKKDLARWVESYSKQGIHCDILVN